MGRPKKVTPKKTVPKKKKPQPPQKKAAKPVKPEQIKDPRIEEIYEKEITFICPVRGLVTQKVKVKRYKSLWQQQQNTKHLIAPMSEFVDTLEEKDSGLSIYNGDDIGVTDTPEDNQ